MSALVSFIIAAYNEERHIVECVESCLSQTHQPIEVVITDDGSTDNTFNLLQSQYAHDPRVKTFRFAENREKLAAFNNCYRHAIGSYIAIVGADDINMPDRIAEQLVAAEVFDLSMTDIDTVNADNSQVLTRNWCSRLARNYAFEFRNMLMNPLGVPSIFFKRELGDLIFPIPEDMIHEDFYIPLVACYHGRVGFLGKSLYRYRLHSGNTSGITASRSSDPTQQCRRATRDVFYYRRVREFLLLNKQQKYLPVVEVRIVLMEYLEDRIIRRQQGAIPFETRLSRALGSLANTPRDWRDREDIGAVLLRYVRVYGEFHLWAECRVLLRLYSRVNRGAKGAQFLVAFMLRALWVRLERLYGGVKARRAASREPGRAVGASM